MDTQDCAPRPDKIPELERIAGTIAPLEEFVGVVQKVTDETVTLLCRRQITLRVGKKILAESQHFLRKGTLVAILKLDDGNFRARPLAPAGNIDSENGAHVGGGGSF